MLFKPLILSTFLLGGALASLPTDCTPPPTPADSTYGLCAYPLNGQAAENTQPIHDYFTNQAGCKSTSGDRTGVITGHGCDAPAPDDKTGGVQGWSIDGQFNPNDCPPGSQCP